MNILSLVYQWTTVQYYNGLEKSLLFDHITLLKWTKLQYATFHNDPQYSLHMTKLQYLNEIQYSISFLELHIEIKLFSITFKQGVYILQYTP